MEIRKAKVLGFCVGVRRAVQMIEQELDSGPLATLGAVVHNSHVIERLAGKGARVVHSLDEVDEGAVAITAHGTAKPIYQKIKQRGLRLIDATCPIVAKAQKVAHKLAEEGFDIIIYGEEDHPEVQGILGWCSGKGVAVLNPEALINLKSRKIALISQTTKGQDFTWFVRGFLEQSINKLNEARIINTTCPETAKRYQAAEELARWAELILVVGGRNSANTRRLAKMCVSVVETYHIEDADEVKREWLEGKERIGVTAGASTPDEAIEAVIWQVEELAGTSVEI
jgi:4-hydroxy-3-methylbut-2-enyl diphosphate reductase